MLLRDVMTAEVVTAAPDRTVREIAELMRERNVGSVVIVGADGAPVGFVTDRDLTLSVIADGRDFGDHVADHASSPVICADPNMDVEESAELMVRHAVRRLRLDLVAPCHARDAVAGQQQEVQRGRREADQALDAAPASELARGAVRHGARL